MTGTLGLILREFKAGRYHQGGLYALAQTMPYRWSRTLPPGKSKVAVDILRNTGRANLLVAIGTLDLIHSQGRSLRPSVKYVDDKKNRIKQVSIVSRFDVNLISMAN